MKKSVDVFNVKGEKIEALNLNPEVFENEINEKAINDAVILTFACQRQGTKKVKTRAEVSGGGVKPWRQKGTGRARAGSIRSNIFRHGGVALGPVPQDFSKKMNKKVAKAALKSAILSKLEDFVVVEDIKLATPKTKEVLNILNNLKLQNDKVLIVVPELDENIILASRNITNVILLEVSELNVLDLINNSKILITKEALKEVEEVLNYAY
jgi:50S ribosomal protein L4